MIEPSELIRASRRRSGLTQAQLAARLGTTQSGIARLEAAQANPTVATLAQTLDALGFALELRARRRRPELDESQLVERLRLSPAERLAAFEASARSLRELTATSRRVA